MASSTCDINLQFDDGFRPEPFQPTSELEWLVSATPRFGLPSDQVAFIEGDDDDVRRDYLLGLVSASIAIFCFFMVWILLVALLKYRGMWGVLRLPKRPEKPMIERIATEQEEEPSSSDEDVIALAPLNVSLQGDNGPGIQSKELSREGAITDDNLAISGDIFSSGEAFPQGAPFSKKKSAEDISSSNKADNNNRSSLVSQDESNLILSTSRHGPLDIDYQGLQQEPEQTSEKGEGVAFPLVSSSSKISATGSNDEIDSEIAAIPSHVESESTDESSSAPGTPSEIATSSYYFKTISASASSSSSTDGAIIFQTAESLMQGTLSEDEKKESDLDSDCTPKRSNKRPSPDMYLSRTLSDDSSQSTSSPVDSDSSSADSSDVSSILSRVSGLMYNASSMSNTPAIQDIQETIPEEMSDHSVPSPVAAEGLMAPSSQIQSSMTMTQSKYSSPALQKKRNIEQYISQRKLLQEQSVSDVSVERGGWTGTQQEFDNFLQFNASVNSDSEIEEPKISPKESQMQVSALSYESLEQPKDESPKKSKANSMKAFNRSLLSWENEAKETYDHHRKLQFVILLCSLCIIVASVLFSLKGTEILLDSVQEEREHLSVLESKISASMESVVDFEKDLQLVKTNIESLLDTINLHCPRVRSRICDDIGLGLGCDFSGLPLESQMLDFANFFQKENVDIGFRELGVEVDDFTALGNLVKESGEKVGQFETALWAASGCTTVLAVLSIVVFCTVILSMQQKQGLWYGLAWFRSKLLVPLFFLFLAIAFVCAMVFIIGSTATGDFCSSTGPDEKVMAYLDKIEPSSGSTVFGLMKYYVDGCPASDYGDTFKDRFFTILDFQRPVTRFSNEAGRVNSDIVEEFCGESFTTVQQYAKSLDRQICTLAGTLKDLGESFSCRNWQPFYELAAYDSICYDSISGFLWAASTQFVIVVMGLLLWTCRAGLFPILEVGEEDDTACRCCPGFVPRDIEVEDEPR